MKVIVAMKVADLEQEHLEWCAAVIGRWVSGWSKIEKQVKQNEDRISLLVKTFKHLTLPSKAPLYRSLWLSQKAFAALAAGKVVPLKKRLWISTTTNKDLKLETKYAGDDAPVNVMVQLPTKQVGLDLNLFEKLCRKRAAELKADVKAEPMMTVRRKRAELDLLEDLVGELGNLISEEKEWIVPGSALPKVDPKNVVSYIDGQGKAGWVPFKLGVKTKAATENPLRGKLHKKAATALWSSSSKAETAMNNAPTAINKVLVRYRHIHEDRIDVYTKKDNKLIGFWGPA